ncbi:hypothetical protein AB0M39_01945 [Streptomyces sp. NPDC051907]|uniref:hypothetical protein n=1 Tax=Streptomyces sp. NPDC051907 TaxID=3155284 RepID=UPI00341D94EF
MGGLLAELGKRIAERWLTLLVLPGALYLAALATAQTLGHAHPVDLTRLSRRLDQWAAAAQPHSSSRIALVLLGLLLAAAAAGLAAQALGSLAERLALAADWEQWPKRARRLARRRVARRREQWLAASERYAREREEAAAARARAHRAGGSAQPLPTDGLGTAYAALVRIAPELPERPTWMGDRLAVVATRLDRDLDLDLATVWPHLWLSVPDATRTEVTAARGDLTRAASLAGWGLLYGAVGALWWPGALLAAAITATAWRRARAATDAYATLVEAVCRLHTAALARELGLEVSGPVTRPVGAELTRLLQTGQRYEGPGH